MYRYWTQTKPMLPEAFWLRANTSLLSCLCTNHVCCRCWSQKVQGHSPGMGVAKALCGNSSIMDILDITKLYGSFLKSSSYLIWIAGAELWWQLSNVTMKFYREPLYWYPQVSNIRCTLVGIKIVDHSDVVGAPPVGAAPTTSSFST